MSRPDIPEAMKREVRQRCFFGCVLCGRPVYHYDHVEDYAVVRTHDVDNLALLCPTHHQDKTSKRLSSERVAKALAAPFNSTRSLSSPTDNYYDLDYFEMVVGSMRIFSRLDDRDRVEAVNVDGATVFGVRKDKYGTYGTVARLCTEDNRPFLIIRDGELRLSTGVWDATTVGTMLTLRDASKKVLAKMDLRPTGVHLIEADFWANGSHFTASVERGFRYENRDWTLHNFDVEDARCIYAVGDQPPESVLVESPEDRARPPHAAKLTRPTWLTRVPAR